MHEALPTFLTLYVDYETTIVVTAVIGSAAVAASIVLVVLEIMKFRRTLKALKKAKK